MQRNVKALLATAGLLASFVLGGSCASACAEIAAQTHIGSRTQRHVYEKPLDEVWRDVRAVIDEEGLEARPVEGRRFTLETPWRERRVEGRSERSRHVVRGVALGKKRARVEVTLETISEGDAGPQRTTSRALDLEWRILLRADPAAAARIEAEAQRRAEEARASCQSCGAACGDAVETVISS